VQRGIIKSYDKSTNSGTIGRALEVDVRFFADKVLGRDRSTLMQGDQIWFELEQIDHHHVAINIRKCM